MGWRVVVSRLQGHEAMESGKGAQKGLKSGPDGLWVIDVPPDEA